MLRRSLASLFLFAACAPAAPTTPGTAAPQAADAHGGAPGVHDLHDPGSTPDLNERPGLKVACQPTADDMPLTYEPPVSSSDVVLFDDVLNFKLTTIVQSTKLGGASDLAFHPTRDELWVITYDTDAVITVTHPGKSNQTASVRQDPAHMHFMHFPTALSMGTNDTWATCGDNTNGGNLFMGPTLFSADPDVFGLEWTELGSHLDMLHASPNCMGIDHVSANKYWVFNGYHSSLDLYDFAVDHGPGNDDHSDGKMYRYAEGLVKRSKGVPSHIAYDKASGAIYVADTGNKRIVRFDPKGATKGTDLEKTIGMEPVVEYRKMNGGTLTTVVAEGLLQAPSGLELIGDELWVTDNETSAIHVFDKNGTSLRTYRTKLSPGSLGGLTQGPDGKIYLVDMNRFRVYRLDE